MDLKQLSGAEFIDFSEWKVRKVNRTTRLLTGTVVVVNPNIDNKVKIEFELYKKQGGEYRKQAYTLPPKGSCDFINQDTYFYPEIVKVSNAPEKMPCPLPVV